MAEEWRPRRLWSLGRTPVRFDLSSLVRKSEWGEEQKELCIIAPHPLCAEPRGKRLCCYQVAGGM